jgi:hypothetical protein
MPKSLSNEIELAAIDRDARSLRATLLAVGKRVAAEYSTSNPRRADRRLSSLNIGNCGRGSIENDILFDGYPLSRPQGGR